MGTKPATKRKELILWQTKTAGQSTPAGLVTKRCTPAPRPGGCITAPCPTWTVTQQNVPPRPCRLLCPVRIHDFRSLFATFAHLSESAGYSILVGHMVRREIFSP